MAPLFFWKEVLLWCIVNTLPSSGSQNLTHLISWGCFVQKLDSPLALHLFPPNPPVNHGRLGLSFKQHHHLEHNQKPNSGNQDGVSQSPHHHPKEPKLSSPYHYPDYYSQQHECWQWLLAFDLVMKKFESLSLLALMFLLNFFQLLSALPISRTLEQTQHVNLLWSNIVCPEK